MATMLVATMASKEPLTISCPFVCNTFENKHFCDQSAHAVITNTIGAKTSVPRVRYTNKTTSTPDHVSVDGCGYGQGLLKFGGYNPTSP